MLGSISCRRTDSPHSGEAPDEEGKEHNEAEKGQPHPFPGSALQISQGAHAAEVDGCEADRGEQEETERISTDSVWTISALSTKQPLWTTHNMFN